MAVDVVARSRGGRGAGPSVVTVRAEALADLQDELAAERAEGLELAAIALDATRHIEAYYDRPHIVMHHAGRIDVAARRFRRQRSAA